MVTGILRQDFKEYMQKRYPNDSNISSTISMAFFLERYSGELNIDFQQILSDRSIPESYKQKLETYFASCGRKDPHGNASTYTCALRLLLEYLDGKPAVASGQLKADNGSVASNRDVFEKPSDRIMQITRGDVDNAYSVYVRGHYDKAENLLRDILTDPLFKHNTDERVVALKIGLIDTLYSTNLIKGQSTTSLPDLALTISRPGLRFDDRILRGDISLVADVLKGARNNFSFVSKYCKIHEYYLSETDNFAIYDSIVSKILFHFLPQYDLVKKTVHTSGTKIR